ncbi:MAG: DUF1572 family protein [Flavobacteriales bacterium]|nr:DUF1572 family protein [Flavobacteriales bacterium]
MLHGYFAIMELDEQIKAESIRRLQEGRDRLVKCLHLLEDGLVWHRPNTHVVSVGNLVLHLCGNVEQWINSTLGGKPDNRFREDEFNEQGPLPVAALEKRLADVLDQAVLTIRGLTPHELTRMWSVQGFTESGTAILMHVVEHFSYHTGQVTLHTKLLLDIDTGYYAGQDLNAKT